MNVFRGILESFCLSVCPSVYKILVSVKVLIGLLTLSQRQILDSSKLKELTDNNFKFNESDRKFSGRVENTAGKGEIARYE